jgi:hypothetical protein
MVMLHVRPGKYDARNDAFTLFRPLRVGNGFENVVVDVLAAMLKRQYMRAIKAAPVIRLQ